MPSESEVVAAIELAHRTEWGFVVASVARLLGGDLDLAEECTQEAFISALQTWPSNGIPLRPGAWLTTTARRKAVDLVRREATLRAKLPSLVQSDADVACDPQALVEEDVVIADDRLRLVFTCCHPALAVESRYALTLRLICGLTTEEIARAFLVPEATMAARITRAKRKIAMAGIPYRVPAGAELPDRIDGVLTVIHLVYTAGYAASGEAIVRVELTDRALDLARVLTELMPDESEALALLSLLELTDARRGARTSADGSLVLLEEQDRGLWDHAAIARGLSNLDHSIQLIGPTRTPGRFVLQAAIAGVHDESLTWADTDWMAILALYDRLCVAWPSPVVETNRAIAVAFAVGLPEGLVELDLLADDPGLARYHYLPAARADLLRRAGRVEEAVASYRAAIALAPEGQERNFLQQRVAQLTIG